MKQLRLFSIPCTRPHKWPLYQAIIIDEGELYVYYKNAWTEAQAKKLAAKEHNKKRGFIESCYVEFGEVKRMKGGVLNEQERK